MMAATNASSADVRSALETLLTINNDIAIVALAFTMLIGIITTFGVYISWKLYSVESRRAAWHAGSAVSDSVTALSTGW